jgi:predicted kinase
MTRNPKVLVLSGTCGSGKTTIAGLIGAREGWCHVSEDGIWPRHFGKDRGVFGTPDHRRKRGVVHREVLEMVRAARRDGLHVVIDATIHEAPPEALEEYRTMFSAAGIEWYLCVLYPRVEVAIARDAGRERGSLGAARVAALHSKFTGRVIPAECFLDTSSDTPEATAERVLESLANSAPHLTAPRARS